MGSLDEQLAVLFKQNEEIQARLADLQHQMAELQTLIRGQVPPARPELRVLEGGDQHTDG